MYDFKLVTPDNADELAKPILADVKAKYGMVPNFFGALGIDGASLTAFLAMQENAVKLTSLSKKAQELIALAVGNENGCHYCVSGHTFSATKMAGLTKEACVQAQKGLSDDAKEQAIINVALEIVRNRGKVSAETLAAAKNAGITEAEIVQITLFTAMNSFTNWVNNIVDPAIDFPAVDLV